MFVASKAGLLNAILNVTAGWTGAGPTTIRLFSNVVTPTPTSQLSDFTEADFTGYGAVTISSWTDSFWASQGAAFQMPGVTVVFAPASPYTVGQVIYGYFVQNTPSSGPATLVGAEVFPSPVSMSQAGDQIVLGFLYGISNSGLSCTIV
jgi:hypothetical protein